MKISELIKNLERVQAANGDIEVTCTGSFEADSQNPLDGKPFETTVENLQVGNVDPFGKRVRLYL